MPELDEPERHLRRSNDTAIGLVDSLTQLSFAIQGLLGRTAAEHHLTVMQARLLGILRDRTPTINDIAKMLLLDKSSVTGLVDRAQERGLVARLASESDRRSVRVTITAQGRELSQRASAAFEARMAELVTCLTATERTQLEAAASQIVIADARRLGIDLFSEIRTNSEG